MEEEGHQPTTDAAAASGEKEDNTKKRSVSWAKLRRVGSLNVEAGDFSFNPTHRASHQESWSRTLRLTFQCIGVIFGDLGTSPLYTMGGTFPDGIQNRDDVVGVASLIIYTLILLPLIKYVFIVLWANDNGDGGTFALYSLICRYANAGLIPNDQPEDRQLSNYRLDSPSNQLRRAEKIKEKLGKSKTAKIVLFLVTILGTSMVIGDGILTPCISVLSAVGGIKGLNEDVVAYISIAILIFLFAIQRFGTDKVGYSFAPGLCIWFVFISGIGLYNIIKHDVRILRAFNPIYIVDYFKRNGKKAWVSLGGVVLCTTGTEAMFADLGHFNVRAVQISFSTIVFPSIILQYIGQAAYLYHHPAHVDKAFYAAVPSSIYWPTFVVANLAAIIASQSMISGTFSIISQSLSLGCFPRVKVVHTSSQYEGQVYIPEINYLLMIACVLVTYGFKTTEKIGNAYGIAIVAVMLITTALVTLIMLIVWKTNIWYISLFFIVFMSIDLTYFSSVLYKFKQGGYLPLAFALALMTMMSIWHYAHQQRYMFELKSKVPSAYIKELAKNRDINRIPGIGLLYSELVQGIPPIFPHFISNIPSIHSVMVLVSIKSIPISRVALEERFLFRQFEPRDYRIFRCVVRYGYKDRIEEPKEFERQLVENLKEFIRQEHLMLEGGAAEQMPETAENTIPDSAAVQVEEPVEQQISRRNSSGSVQGAEEEMEYVQRAMEQGVFYLIGEADVVARKESSLLKKFVINYGYTFLRKNFRQGEKALAIPQTRLLKVGMTYEI